LQEPAEQSAKEFLHLYYTRFADYKQLKPAMQTPVTQKTIYQGIGEAFYGTPGG
jgi:hypothetical protein